MPTINVTINGRVRELAPGKPLISDVEIEVFDWIAEVWCPKSTTTGSEGKYSLSVDLEVDDGEKINFYVRASKSDYDDTGRSRESSKSGPFFVRLNMKHK